MIILDGKKVSEELLIDIKKDISKLSYKLGLSIILVGDKKDSIFYVNSIKKYCERLNIDFFLKHFNENISSNDLIKEIEILNNDDSIHGILIQSPLPLSLKKNEKQIFNSICPKKDIDGVNIYNAGKLFLNHDIQFIPCTALGCLELLDYYDINVEGLNVVVLGASNIIGLPLSILLLQRGATVTTCHIKTKNVKSHTINADLLISCCGVANLVENDWIKQDAIIIDVGINFLDNKLVGDVNFDSVKDKCKYITPVPGGVGPMTITMLFKQLIK